MTLELRPQVQGADSMALAIGTLIRLERLAIALYTKALTVAYPQPLLPDESAVISAILQHQKAHLTTLLGMVTSGAPAEASFDFTGDKGTGFGPFRNACGAPAGTAPNGSAIAEAAPHKLQFLKLAMLLEDLSTRAYMGVLESAWGTAHVQTLFGMQLAEARHATLVRLLRRSYNPSSGVYTAPQHVTSAWVELRNYTTDPGVPESPFSYGGLSLDTVPVYPGGLSQNDIAVGKFTYTGATTGEGTFTITQQGVYGPGTPSINKIPQNSTGEDNRVHTTSQVRNGIVKDANMFDQPLSPSAVKLVVDLFYAS